jgi:hypothetical protein
MAHGRKLPGMRYADAASTAGTPQEMKPKTRCGREARSLLLALLMATLPAAPAWGGGDWPPRYWFLKSLGPADLARTDWLLLRQNVLLALYELADGQSVGWVDPDTSHAGAVRVIGSWDVDGGRCRQIQVSVEVDDRSDVGNYPLCRHGQGFWVFPNRIRTVSYGR